MQRNIGLGAIFCPKPPRGRGYEPEKLELNSPGWQSGWIKLAKQGGAALERLYTLHIYGGQRITAIDENAARDIWERLSRPLR